MLASPSLVSENTTSLDRISLGPLRHFLIVPRMHIGIVGFAMLLGSTQASVKYAGTFLGAVGIYPCIANTISWTANNVEGVYKRGVTLGFVIGWGNINGIVSSNIYRDKDSPNYRPGHGVVLVYLVLFLLGGSLATHFLLVQENKKRMDGKRDEWIVGKGEGEIELLGDKRPDFIYNGLSAYGKF